jgi:hypothetical protein
MRIWKHCRHRLLGCDCYSVTMSHLSEKHAQSLYDEFGELKVLDDIIQHRAADDPPAPILAYPRTERSVADFEYFTGKDLDRLIDGAVKRMIVLGLQPVCPVEEAKPSHP